MATSSDGVTDEVLANLLKLFTAMDAVRDHFNVPIVVHVAYRPQEYNALIGGAAGSAHMEGKAVDFHIGRISCDDVRERILQDGLLEKLGLRMEQLPKGSGWIHLDTREPAPGHPRYFIP